jgi:hypothetical protein
VVIHRLRETNKKIHLHTVPDTLESLCQFLTLKCLAFSQQNQATPHFPWFILVDEFSLLTRIKRDDIQKTAQILIARRLVSINNSHELMIPDPQLLDILREAQNCARRHEPFAVASIDAITQSCLEFLPNSAPKALENMDALGEELRTHVDSRVSISHIHKLRELGTLRISETDTISIDKSRLEWILKAHRDLNRILDKKEAR